ncbi:hypothetical protein [Goodfellowiella coeruleoviolacea]|uniref:Uncharacterized protein n=1 Tax=Goodfellowiella coeruleoviolacea TaxID=334858 RepID=A0AAE3KFQ5_9PSEU|nr:hypothetical protein [Goodfellowiella coeruleoviolacea]MCP2164659.1 hypothetical protein [Goodfellowiella coeruleoviolacea]
MYQHPDTLRADIRFREQDCRDQAAASRLARLAVRRRSWRRALTAPAMPNPATGTGCGLPACPFVATS